MPKTIKVTVYKFDELLPKAQERVVRDWCKDASEHFDSGSTTELFKDRLKEEWKISDVDVFWRLASCQGDGVAFQGEPDADLLVTHDFLKAEYDALVAHGLSELWVTIRHEGIYYHSNSMQVSVEPEWKDDADTHAEWEARDKMVSGLEYTISQHVINASRAMEKLGYQDIEYASSEENARDYLKGSGELYYVDGRAWDG